MAVDLSLAQASNNLVYSAMAVYTVALVAFAGEMAFGSRGRVARVQAEQGVPVEERVLVGAGAVSPEPPSAVAAVADEPAAAGGERWGRVGVSLTVLAAVLQLGAVVTRGLAVHRPPWGNMYEFTVAGTLLAVAGFLLVLRRNPVRYLGVFVVAPVLLALGLAVTVLYVDAAALVPALDSYWLVIHVTAVMLGAAIFAVGAAVTVLFLLKDAEERSGRTGVRAVDALLRRLPSAASLDRTAYRLHAFAFPIYTFAVMAGAVWAEYAWGRYWGWDPKETWAFITWVFYAGYLHARATAGWKGRTAAVIALLGFSCFLFNYYGVNFLLPGRHSYAK